MENKKLQEQITIMKTLMSEQETKEGMVDDIKKFLYDKISGVVSGTKLGNALDDLLQGDTPTKDELSFFDSESKNLNDNEKKEVYSKVMTDDDFYKAILWGLGLPVTQRNIDFFKLWRIAEMGVEKNGTGKETATNNPFNTTFDNFSDKNQSKFNFVGVKNYSKPEYGIESTVKTLKNGYYNCILDGLRNGSDYKEIASCSRRDGKKTAMDTWGTTTKGLLSVIEKFKNNPGVAKKIDMNLE
jgi:hypothetical protein